MRFVEHKRKRFNRVLVGITLSLCALVLGTASAKAEENPNDFRQRLLERSRLYLETIQHRTSQWSPEQRGRVEKQAYDTINKGFAKIAHSAREQRFASMDSEMVSAFFRRAGDWHSRSSVMKVAEFLALNFYQPTEWDVLVRTALPSRFQWECRFGVLVAHSPFSGSMFDFFGLTALGGSEMIVTPSPPRDPKTLTLLFGQTLLSTLSDPCNNGAFRHIDDGNLLAGFHQIAQTIVLRI